MLKRLFDFALAAGALVVLSPLLLFLAAIIKLHDAGPVFYLGIRVGMGGAPFRMLKFRTMRADAEKIGGPSTPADDPRITSIGNSLRRYKLDELPQLINILKGDMSFVGPRPEVPKYVALYGPGEEAILSVRPGITDFASLWNSDEGALLAGSQDPEQTYLEKIRPEKLRLQLEYVRKRNFLIDLRILALTVGAIVFRARPRALKALCEKGREACD